MANSNPAVQPQAAFPTSTRLADRLSPVPEYVPPVAIQQISPTRLTPAQRSFLSRPVVVEIKVFIDASGKVLKTEPLTHTSPVLITAARSAAILWKFQPARREGLSVASEIILRFKFDPAQ
jgi:outer membrane biosynthesis protein TonB